MEEFKKRSSYYQDCYELVPQFKAGVHGGMVTAVEIGDIKRDIAYHGDVLNTAARLQGLCNRYDQYLLVSMQLLSRINLNGTLEIEQLGYVNLKGKNQAIDIAGIKLHRLKE
jgi:adenylate cyclase